MRQPINNLNNLNLAINNLDENDLPGGVFSGVGDTLLDLNLGGNSLNVIRSDLLTGLSSLQYLSVHVCQITTIELGKKLE